MQPPPTILCVDDEPMVLTALRNQFARQLPDHEVEVAQDGEEALEILEELREAKVAVPVVISDHIMPGMKGDELLVRVRALLPDTRTILLTGQAGLDAVGRAINEAGLFRYISKPWDREDLALTVREAIWAHQAELTVRAQQAQLAEAHAAAVRFVPHEFLALLGRTDLTEVLRGDYAEQQVSVYYSDIRSYTTLVEDLGAQESLGWINEYQLCMEGAIRRHGGFVTNIAGDAIVALFGGGAQPALRAGVDSFRALDEYNIQRQERGDPPLRIGIGLSTGPVLLGVIGGVERLKAGLVGDVVNLAARVEGLTRNLGSMLITGETRAALPDPDAHALRYVDRVRVKGRSSQTELYEVLDVLPSEQRAGRLATRERFEAAIGAFQQGALDEAERSFSALFEETPDDQAVAWYLARIRRAQA